MPSDGSTDDRTKASLTDSARRVRIAETNVPTSPDQCRYPEKKIKPSWKRLKTWTFVLNLGTFLAVAGYACVAAIQLSEIRRSNMLDERAWVGVKSMNVGTLEVEKNIVVEVALLNSGKSLANKVQGYATLAVSDSRTLLEFPEPSRAPVESVAVFWPGMDLKLEVSGTAKTPVHRFAFDKSGLENILANRAFLFVYGAYTYVDIFDRPHTTRFCERYSAEDPRGFDSCANYNYAD